MNQRNFEKTVANTLLVGLIAISVIVFTSGVTDPVNETKLVALGGVGLALALLFFVQGFKSGLETSRVLIVLSGFFFIASVSAVLNSSSPLEQNLYGVYGRNTGFLTYFFLLFLLLGGLLLSRPESFGKIFKALFITGLINVLYCGWVVFFGDFIGWSNLYGNILGLLGNPNFIGAFLGIWVSATFGYLLGAKTMDWKFYTCFPLLLLGLYEIYKSHAVQGVVVSAAGFAIVGFYFIRSRTKGFAVVSAYVGGVLAFGIVALLGALQKGPLAEIIYKNSVSLRGSYWNAGLVMGRNHPFTGVGMDAYGDWYRRTRSLNAATVMPGPRTVTNSAHNVVIDIFSYGGFPLLLPYLGMIALGAWAIFVQIRKSRIYDPVFVALSVAWVGYQLQSIISINQIGLAIWGWVLTGALVAYSKHINVMDAEIADGGKKVRSGRKVTKSNNEVLSPQLLAGVGLVVGLIIASPPMSADMAWFKATASSNFNEVQKALVPSYLHPQSSERYVNAVGILENSKLYDQALLYAQKAVAYNPANFDSWFALYSVKNSTPEMKKQALAKMKMLDPRNPDLPKS